MISIYALTHSVGDIARFHWELTGEDLRVEHWSHAENTGRFAAFNILGGNKVFDKVPYFWTVSVPPFFPASS